MLPVRFLTRRTNFARSLGDGVIPSAERDLAESHANIFLQSPCAGSLALLEMTETQMFFLFVNTMKLMTQNHAS